MLSQVNLPHEELSINDLVAIEVPPLTHAKFDHDLHRFVAKVRVLGPKVAVIVQPSMRKKTQRAFWVQQWNRSSDRPFRFKQACSCQLGNGTPGCYLMYYIGCVRFPLERWHLR